MLVADSYNHQLKVSAQAYVPWAFSLLQFTGGLDMQASRNLLQHEDLARDPFIFVWLYNGLHRATV